VADFRSGMYCSRCQHSATEIRKNGEDFWQHLQRVNGHPIPAPEDVVSLVDEACRTFEAQAEARSLQLRPDVRGEPGLVACDRGRILQVLGNLLGNAIKFTDQDGRIEVRAERVDGQICFAVSDSGVGIPERDLTRVFERHFRAGEQRGTGLGLFIAKGIVEAHGGALSVESRVGKGTTFHFSLPAPRR
jgi:signal transduction histidine kinase